MQCGGKNSRYNSLTVDGVRMNDSFGLNDNGYPTERMPFSYDAISQVTVELAPFDVEYGGFSACNINAVTKSGGNEFSGSAFYDYTSDDLRGDKLEGDSIQTGTYTEKRYGVTFGGPIIQDKLFFFAAYEKLEGANLFDRGPIGSGAVNEVDVTQAELDEIADIANEFYLYDPGSIPSSIPTTKTRSCSSSWTGTSTTSSVWRSPTTTTTAATSPSRTVTSANSSSPIISTSVAPNSIPTSARCIPTGPTISPLRFALGYLELDNRQISVGRYRLRRDPGASRQRPRSSISAETTADSRTSSNTTSRQSL